jgi:cellobiose phosphorylase
VRCLLGVRREKSWLTLDPVLPRVLDGLRVDFEIAQRPVTITYQVGAAGCGPIDVALNGAALPFTRGANPYRTGAAEIPMAEFAARLRASGNVLTVRLG